MFHVTFTKNDSVLSIDMMFIYINEFKPKAIKIKVSDYVSLLDNKIWYCCPGNDVKFSPKYIIEHKTELAFEYKRIENADLKYPIIMHNNDIVDGHHRLSKAYILNKKFIYAYVFDTQLINKFIIMKKGTWDKINNLKAYEIMAMYNKQFKKKNKIR